MPGKSISLLSVIIPVYNEAESLPQLADEIYTALENQSFSFELIFVDDGSTDSSWAAISELTQSFDYIKAVQLRINCGKSQALAIGIQHAKGDTILTLDADLQDIPSEIPKLVACYREGNDLVVGWKKERFDPWHKLIPSKIFNTVIKFFSKLEINDCNSGFKLADIKVFKAIPIYGELHRFIPVLAHNMGFQIKEVPVLHRARTYGKSKFGIERFWRGAIDLGTVLSIFHFGRRPAHLFAGVGFIVATIGSSILAYLSILWFLYPEPIGDRPLLLVSILLILGGLQILLFGFLAEFILFRTIEEQRINVIKEVI